MPPTGAVLARMPAGNREVATGDGVVVRSVVRVAVVEPSIECIIDLLEEERVEGACGGLWAVKGYGGGEHGAEVVEEGGAVVETDGGHLTGLDAGVRGEEGITGVVTFVI